MHRPQALYRDVEYSSCTNLPYRIAFDVSLSASQTRRQPHFLRGTSDFFRGQRTNLVGGVSTPRPPWLLLRACCFVHFKIVYNIFYALSLVSVDIKGIGFVAKTNVSALSG